MKEYKFLISFIFVNHKRINKDVKAADHFQAVSKAMEVTCEDWPVQRPISIMAVTTALKFENDFTRYYRVTKSWALTEERRPYRTTVITE